LVRRRRRLRRHHGRGGGGGRRHRRARPPRARGPRRVRDAVAAGGGPRVKIARRSQVPPFAVMQVLAEANRRRAAGEDVISLCAGRPSDGAPRAVREAARAVLADGDLGYTEAIGIPALRLAIAEHYGRWYDVHVDPGRVAITTGSSGAFLLAFLT